MSAPVDASASGGSVAPVRAMHAPAPSLAMSAGQAHQLQQQSAAVGQQDISERMRLLKMEESQKAAAAQQQQGGAAAAASGAPTALSPTNGSGAPKKKEMGAVRYAAERVIGNGSFGVVYQATVIETGETVAIKKVLQVRSLEARTRRCCRTSTPTRIRMLLMHTDRALYSVSLCCTVL